MQARLMLNRRTLHHPVAKGDASELEWIALLSTYLPTRYNVEKAFIIDHKGIISHQIDIVIFDRHFSPFLFRQNGQIFVPAESVYAVFEVKQELSITNIKYASRQIASVRALKRTSAEIVDRGAIRPPRSVPHIIGGIVCLSGALTQRCEKVLTDLGAANRIDLGCSLTEHSFYVDFEKNKCEKSGRDDSLVFFFLKLLGRLQKTGTIPPMEIEQYAEALK
jgi:hypothetical protein